MRFLDDLCSLGSDVSGFAHQPLQVFKDNQFNSPHGDR